MLPSMTFLNPEEGGKILRNVYFKKNHKKKFKNHCFIENNIKKKKMDPFFGLLTRLSH